MEQENLLRLAGRVLRWGRNNVRTDSVETVVSETDDVVDWLTDPRAGLADESTLVLVREARRGRYLPRTWLRYRGSLDEPGDEMLIGDALRVQVTDYVSLRYVQVTGLTVVRLSTPEDVAAFLTDLRAARTGGRVPETLMSPIVELGDRCALTAGVPCTAYGPGPRLHVSADHAVRTVPGGRVIGRLGDDRRTLAASTSTHAAHGDACLDGPVSAALYAVHPAERAGYLAALDAIRTMTARVQAPWWVSGLGFRVADRALADEPCPPRTDLLLLSTVDEQVLFDARAVRGFRIGRGMAEVVDVLLHSSRPDVALERLYRCPNVPGDPARTAGEVCAELARRGVSLPWAPAPARAA